MQYISDSLLFLNPPIFFLIFWLLGVFKVLINWKLEFVLFDFISLLSLFSLLFLEFIISLIILLREGVAFAFKGEVGVMSLFSIIFKELFKKLVISCKAIFLDFSLNQEVFCICVLFNLFNLFPIYCFNIFIVLFLRAIKFFNDFSLILFIILWWILLIFKASFFFKIKITAFFDFTFKVRGEFISRNNK